MGIGRSIYEAVISPRMRIAIRQEATLILQSGRYLRSLGCCGVSGAVALAKVFESVYNHRNETSAQHLFRNVVGELPLRHPLNEQSLSLCDLRGCKTVGDVAGALMQRIVVTCVAAEVQSRLSHIARNEHGATPLLAWPLAFATCTCCCLSCYENLDPLPACCACCPCCITETRTKRAREDFEVALEGLPSLVVIAVGAAWKNIVSLHEPPYANEFVSDSLLDGRDAPSVNDKGWNWVSMCEMGRGCQDASNYASERMPPPMCAYKVVAEEGVQTYTSKPCGETNSEPSGLTPPHQRKMCTEGRMLQFGDVVHPVNVSDMCLKLPGGLWCRASSAKRWVLRPLTRQWQVVGDIVETFATHPSAHGNSDLGLSSVNESLRKGDIVTAAESTFFAKPTSRSQPQPGQSDLLRVVKLDGELVYKLSWDDQDMASDLDIGTLKRLLCESLKQCEAWMLDLITAAGNIHQDSEKLLTMLPRTSSEEPLEIQMIINARDSLEGEWLRMENGRWVRIFYQSKNHIETHLLPILSPTALADGATQSLFDPNRIFYDPAEFAQLAGFTAQWQQLRDPSKNQFETVRLRKTICRTHALSGFNQLL